MKFTKESILKSLNSLTMPAWIKRVFQLIVDYIDDAASSINNKADLVGGKVPAEQLPSYVDDVMEFVTLLAFSDISTIIGKKDYANNIYITTNTTIDPYKNLYLNTGTNNSIEDWTYMPLEKGKIYLNTSNNHTYRWSDNKLIDLDKDWSDQINELNAKTITVYLGYLSYIKDPLDLSELQNTSVFSVLYMYLNQRVRYPLINLRWRYDSADYSSPIIDVDPIERTFRIYNQGYLQTYKVLKEDNNYSLVKVKEFPDFVYLDYSTLGAILDDETIEQIKKASMILVNDDANNPNNKSIYVVKSKTNIYLQFIKVDAIDGSDQKIVYKGVSVNTSTKKWVITTKNCTLPYGAYSQFGFTGKNAYAVNQEVARLVNMNSYNITSSDLNKVHSGDKLENIKNATFIILDEGSGKTKIFIRGYTAVSAIYYNCISNDGALDTIILRMPSNELSSIRNVKYDDVSFVNYKAQGGTKGNKALMYKELAAQLTVNTYVINSSILNTTITDTNIREGISKADILIIEDSTNNSYKVYIKGFVTSNTIYFFNLQNVNADNITAARVSFKTTTNLLNSTDVYLRSAFNAYKLGGGTKYTTESAFNAQFAKVIDMTVTQ